MVLAALCLADLMVAVVRHLRSNLRYTSLESGVSLNLESFAVVGVWSRPSVCEPHLVLVPELVQSRAEFWQELAGASGLIQFGAALITGCLLL